MEWTRREREALEAELRARVRGEVRFRDTDRALYACDASIYQVMPIGAVVPRSAEDAAEAVRVCLDAGAPVLPRGGATSLAGQTVGNAVVVDLSKHVNRILEIDREARTAVVEPGVIQSHLNQAAGEVGLMFGPDTASATRATLGGMLGNNSSGAHSILYGKTVDHVRAIEAVLSDGGVHRLGPASFAGHRGAHPKGSLLGGVLELADRVRRHEAGEIRDRYPKVLRRVSGYNLDELLNQDQVNLARLLVGSEGSLGTVLEMEIDLVPAPALKGVALLHFPELEPAIAATTRILGTEPSAVELMDEMLLELAEAHPSFRRKLWFMTPRTKALQLVEYFAESEAELKEKFRRLEALAATLPDCIEVTVARDALQVNDAWAVRKAGLPLLASIPTRRKPLPFVEDTAVDPEKLPAFVLRFKEIVEDHDTRAAYYAHASAGCLHIRPLLDLHDEGDRARLESISEAIFELVCEFGGSMSGEHGDGRARSHYNARLFGPRIYRAFQDLKRAFDPRNLFNPGQVVDAPSMGDDLRWDFHRHMEHRSEGFTWEAEGGFHTAVEACNGTAACRQVGEGSMCPSYMATRDEEHSTRGRANLLRGALSGAIPRSELYGEEIERAMELCLMCKACKSECPVKVDMSRIKAEWLHWKHQAQGMPFGSWVLSRARTWLELGARAPGAANWLRESFGSLANRVLGLSPHKELPALANVGLRGRLAEREAPAVSPRGPVVLFADSFGLHLAPDSLLDAVTLLERAGHRVVVPELGCCGRPALGQGDLEEARRLAEANVAALLPFVEEGIPVVGAEPGCLSMFWDDYPDLLRGEGVRRVAEHVQLVDEYLLGLIETGELELELSPIGKSIGLHPHCHQEALGRADATRELLEHIPDLKVRVLGGGCCGMAGDFGYKHASVSDAVWERTDAARSEKPMCLPGWSCRQKAAGHGKRVYSAATLLRMSCDGESLESP